MHKDQLLKGLIEVKKNYRSVCISRNNYVNNHIKYKKRKRMVRLLFAIMLVVLVALFFSFLPDIISFMKSNSETSNESAQFFGILLSLAFAFSFVIIFTVFSNIFVSNTRKDIEKEYFTKMTSDKDVADLYNLIYKIITRE